MPSADFQFLGTAPWIACHDLQASVRYYRDVLGFNDDDWQWFWGDPPDHAGMSRGRSRVALFENSEKATRYAGVEVVIYVRQVEAYYESLGATGVDVVRPLAKRPWGTLDFTLRDPNGYLLIFTEAPDTF